MANDSVSKTFIVAFLLCVVCSVIVSTAAVSLRPIQETNKLLDMKKNILSAASLYEEGTDIEAVYRESIEAKIVDLSTGSYVSDVDAETFDQKKRAKDPAQSVEIENDLAGIGRRSTLASVYLVKEGSRVTRIILPVHGKGLWSTLYGFLALDVDLNTIKALSFYSHAETPGLGGEVDNPKWKALWDGKKAFGSQGQPEIAVIKGKVDPANSHAEHQVDGLSGATITSRGVSNLLAYWLSEDGFGKFLNRLQRDGV